MMRGQPRMWSGAWAVCVVGLWLGGMLVAGTRVVSGLRSIRHLERESVPLWEGELVQQAHAAQQVLRCQRPATVRLARADAHVVVPMTWGWRCPQVLLPADALAWPDMRRRAILLHELAHVARGDWAALLMAHVVCAVYWFHPLVWWAARSLRTESERATDDRVLAAGVGAGDYGECLLEFVRLLTATQRRPIMKLTLAMARPSTLENRLCALLDPRRSRRGVSRLHVLGGAATVAAALLSTATLGAVDGPPQSGDTPALAAATNKPDLSSPQATVRSFITALENHDFEPVLACIAGVEGIKLQQHWLAKSERLKEIMNLKVAYPFDKLQSRITGNEAVVNIVSKESMRVMSLDGKVRGHGWKVAGRVNLRQVKGRWKIVPLSSADSIPKTYSIVAATATDIATGLTAPDPLSPTLRSDAAAVACYENMKMLGSGMSWPGIGDRRLRLKDWKAKFLSQLKENLRTEVIDPEVFFHCPADKSGAVTYSINENLEGFDMKKATKATFKTVFLYEGKNGRLEFRHHGHAVVQFYDSQVRFVSREEAKNLRWKP